MKILLLGQKGYLGSYLFNNLTVDVLNPAMRKLYSNNKSYDYVINCIGKPNLEYCQTHIKETNYSNYQVINDITLFYPKSKIINFSSYYVYDDKGLCTETSHTTDAYVYCKQKLLGERAIKNGVSFRLGKLFGNMQAKQQKLTEHILQNDNLVLDDVQFNPTSVQQVLRVVEFELKRNTFQGVYNLANRGTASHFGYGEYINTILNTHKKIKRISKIKRQFKNYGHFLMSVEKLQKMTPLTDWTIDMNLYLQEVLNKQMNINIIA